MQKSGILSLGVLFFAHLINDMYTNYLPQFITVMVAAKMLSVDNGASLVAAFTVSSSLTQPIFGYLVDQKGQRWIVYIGTIWMSLLLATTGYLSNFTLLLLVSALAGMGTSAFHPQAAAMVGQASKNNKALIMSIFVTMGNIGLAISPPLLLPLFNTYGTQYTWVIVIPGIIAAVLLYIFAPVTSKSTQNGQKLSNVFLTIKKSSQELSKLMSIVALRSLVHTGLMTFLPLYLLSRKYSPEIVGYLMFATLIAGAIGGIIGGYISDRYGRKPFIIGSLIFAFVFFYGFLYTSGTLSIILLAIGGMALLSSSSVTVVVAQEVIPDNKAFASGLSMGFAIGIGGIAVSLLGKYANYFGISSTIQLIFFIPLVAGCLGLFLKGSSGTEETAV